VPLTGIAVVCTPQDAALRIAVKALQMFRGLNVPALGLIENMSWFVCGHCGEEHHIFDHGGAEQAAKRLGVPYLGAIPLERHVNQLASRVLDRKKESAQPSAVSQKKLEARG